MGPDISAAPTPAEAARRALSDPGHYAGVVGRDSVDYMLRNTQQQLVALSGQADLKASIVITASAIVTSVAATQWDDGRIRWSLVTLTVFLVLGLLAAVAAVLPKFRVVRDPGDELPDHFNPLFFGHYSQIDKHRYLEVMADLVRDDALVYKAIVADLYDQGVYLLRNKYRYLRVSYVCFLAGFVIASIQLGLTEALR